MTAPVATLLLFLAFGFAAGFWVGTARASARSERTIAGLVGLCLSLAARIRRAKRALQPRPRVTP